MGKRHCLFTLIKIQKETGSDLKQDFEVDGRVSRSKYSPINWWEFAQMLDFVRNVLHNNFELFIKYRKREAIKTRKRAGIRVV